MAELIDKSKLMFLLEREMDMNGITDWGKGYMEAIHDAMEHVKFMETTTEAEIKAKALGVMGMAMKEYYPSCKGAYVDFDVYFHAVMAKVAEQMEEGAD